jgi:hypothetical protein
MPANTLKQIKDVIQKFKSSMQETSNINDDLQKPRFKDLIFNNKGNNTPTLN